MHYERWRKHGDPLVVHLLIGATDEQRFWPKVDRRGPDECWLWLAGTTTAGYGNFHSPDLGRPIGAHRFAYELLVGPVADGLHLDHLCRTPACVNPMHLEPVTSRENTMRSPVAPAAVNARLTHCRRGHPFDETNTYRPPNEPRQRHCRACRAEQARQRRGLTV